MRDTAWDSASDPFSSPQGDWELSPPGSSAPHNNSAANATAPQPPAPERGPRGRLPDPELSAAIRACTTWQDCSSLLLEQGGHLDAMLLSNLVTQTVRTAQQQGLADAVATGPADPLQQQPPLQLSAARPVTSLQRCANERAALDAHLAHLATAALRRTGGFRPQQFANVIWGLARLGHRPPPDWVESYLAAAEGQLVTFSPRALSQSAWALGTLRYAPRGPWLGAFLAEAGDKLPDCGAQDLANLLWGLAALGVVPPPYWLRDAALAMEQHFAYSAGPQEEGPAEAAGSGGAQQDPWWGVQQQRRALQRRFKPGELSMCCWALARLGHTPATAWVDALAATAMLQLPEMNPQEAAMLFWALRRWGRPVAPRPLARLTDSALLVLCSAPPDGHALSVVLHAAARLGAQLRGPAARAALQLTFDQMERLTARQLATAAVAVSFLLGPTGTTPPAPWVRGLEAAALSQFMQRRRAQLAERRAVSSAGAAAALAAAALAAAAVGGGGEGNEGATAKDAAQLLMSMRRFQWRPADSWWRAFYATCTDGSSRSSSSNNSSSSGDLDSSTSSSNGGPGLFHAASGYDLSNMLLSIAALHAPPPGLAWMRAFWARVARLLGLPPDGGDLAAPPAPGSGPVGRGAALLDALFSRPEPPGLKPQEASAILFAAARLRRVGAEGAAPPRGVLVALATEVARGLRRATDGDALRALWALGRLRLAAAGANGVALARHLARCCARRAAQMPEAAQEQVARIARRLVGSPNALRRGGSGGDGAAEVPLIISPAT